jgi:hypothetical protein
MVRRFRIMAIETLNRVSGDAVLRHAFIRRVRYKLV